MTLLRTPLYEDQKSRGAFFVEFAGWELPLHYGSIIAEHKLVREKVGLFDLSYMGVILVQGEKAEEFLNEALTQDIIHLKHQHACYSLMCNLSGGVIDDIVVNRLDRTHFFLCLNASNIQKDVNWLMTGKERYGCMIQDVSSKYGILALQGPLAMKMMGRIVGLPESLQRFDVKEMVIQGCPAYVSRTGYMGEDGFEVYCDIREVKAIADTILDRGENIGLKWYGLGARNSLRVECGYCLYGREIDEDISPFEAGLDHLVKMDKPAEFIGMDALVRLRKKELKRKVIFFKLPGNNNIPRSGMNIHREAHVVGKVLSGTFSPMLNQGIGTAIVDFGKIEEPLEVIIRGTGVPLEIVQPPFYKSPC